MNKITVSLMLLTAGIIFRLLLTSDNNFIFNMDNARDFVDVREMVEAGKLRLTGPNSAIEGLYNGPLWYYLLAIPYVLTGGNPYGAIIMQIFFWAVGGFFLLKLVETLSKWLIIPIGLVWVASNYIVLANVYSFNPNPVLLLTPLFIYSLVEYLQKRKGGWVIITWFLAGAFFNFEMNAGVFMPPIILVSLFLINKKAFKDKYFWLGVIVFTATLLPQILFDLKHQFIMSKSIFRFLSETDGTFDPFLRIQVLAKSYFQVFEATLMNRKFLATALLVLAVPFFKRFFLEKEKNPTIIVASLFFLIPFLGYLIIPVSVNPWHLGGFAASSLILIALIINRLWKINFLGKIVGVTLSVTLIVYSIFNVINIFITEVGKPSQDPSRFNNEIAAIDYVYKYANGRNFKIYTYLPSIYDYPYQYLIWWHGLKSFGYLPTDYAYLPNRPQYIAGKNHFLAKPEDIRNREDSNLVFLIKEPNPSTNTRSGWEGEFIKLESIEKKMVGPLEIEVKREIN